MKADNIKYVSGIFALNLVCDLETPGDWHRSSLNWKNAPKTLKSSAESPFGNWGIESGHKIPETDGEYYVANHIRALLDLIAEGNFAVAQGMRDNFIDNDKYDDIIFEKVLELRESEIWDKIYDFMSSEYYKKWVRYVLAT
jgi:hypothetical protein